MFKQNIWYCDKCLEEFSDKKKCSEHEQKCNLKGYKKVK